MSDLNKTIDISRINASAAQEPALPDTAAETVPVAVKPAAAEQEPAASTTVEQAATEQEPAVPAPAEQAAAEQLAPAAPAPEKPAAEVQEEPAGRRKKSRWKLRPAGMAATVLLVLAVFYVVITISYPVHYDNLGGQHSWLSASTVSFVNNWLAEGPGALHFANYDLPASIELTELPQRSPDVSHPTGTTLLVYLAARLTGHTAIDIAFLKHFQVGLFGLEAVLVALFVYLLATGSGYRSEAGKAAMGTLSGVLWILLPANLFYLSNVLSQDECAILWMLLFLPVEYLIRLRECSTLVDEEELAAMPSYERRRHMRRARAKWPWYALRFALLYTGMLIDYFFWVLAAVAALTAFLGDLLTEQPAARKKKARPRVSRALGHTVGYLIPMLLGWLTVRWQRGGVDGWRDLLAEQSLRHIQPPARWTAGEAIEELIRGNFAAESDAGLHWLLIVHLVLLALAVVYLARNGGPARLFRSSQCSILVTGAGAIALYTWIYKTYTGLYEFSMLKFGWWIALLAPVAAILLMKALTPADRETGRRRNPSLSWLMVFFLLAFGGVMTITGVPSVDRAYYNWRNEILQYPVEEAIQEHTGYRDVVVSFNREINQYPPQSMVIAGKQVWRIDRLADVYTLFPQTLRDNRVRLLMLVDYLNGDELTEEQRDILDYFVDEENIVYEDASCVIAEIPDWAMEL